MRFFSVKPLKLIHGQGDLGYMYIDLKSRKGKPPARVHFATKWGRKVSETEYQLHLITNIDGVDALNNVLLIGMTNRKDMMDESLMRPGRLEVQVEEITAGQRIIVGQNLKE